MLEAEYAFVADKVARMQAQVSFLIKENYNYKAIMMLFEGIYYYVSSFLDIKSSRMASLSLYLSHTKIGLKDDFPTPCRPANVKILHTADAFDVFF